MRPECGFEIAPDWLLTEKIAMTNVSNKILLNAAKWQDYSFYGF